MTLPTTTVVIPAVANTAGSTRVTLTGTGYLGATTVTVNGVAATRVTVVDDATLTFLSPAGRTTLRAPIVVTNAAGSAAADVTIELSTSTINSPAEGSECPVHHRVHSSHGWYVCASVDGGTVEP